MTLLDLNPADFRRFLTVLVDRCLLGSMPVISHLCASDIRLRTMLTENEYFF